MTGWYSITPQYIIIQNEKAALALFSPEFLGAFAGAFFAFLFGVISYHLIKRYERFILHRNALVGLERLLNEHLDIIGLNRATALSTQRILEAHRLTHNRLLELSVREGLDTDLGNLDIANRYFIYTRGVHRTNVDTQSMNYTLTRFEDVMIGGKPLEAENWHYITGAFAQIPGHMDKLERETKEILCITRIHIARLARKGIWYANTQKEWSVEVTDEELKKEVMKLEEEIRMVSGQRPSITRT
ncbi:MAG: hypothetical protein U1D31_01950 [Patescibacteria group bacterium]|nr:hypothetical protein [Patescibacteria group bacterium]